MSHFIWMSHGKPNNSHIAKLMRRSRASYKYALRYCRKNEEQIKNDEMAKDFRNNN